MQELKQIFRMCKLHIAERIRKCDEGCSSLRLLLMRLLTVPIVSLILVKVKVPGLTCLHSVKPVLLTVHIHYPLVIGLFHSFCHLIQSILHIAAH